MCGVIGYIGDAIDTKILFQGLKRLEYRGYDSAGIAVLNSSTIKIIKADGKLENLEKKLNLLPEKTVLGMGHTRWATHGKPTEKNAHPHQSENFVLLHNGIIENYKELKSFLLEKKYNFLSETDTEVALHYLHYEYHVTHQNEPNKLLRTKKSIQSLVKKITGAFAFVIINSEVPDHLFVVKLGSPLVLGIGLHGNYVASGITFWTIHVLYI